MGNLRQETRDRLAFLNDCPPPPPIKIMPNSIFKELMYKYAKSIGFTGSKDDVEEAFLAALQGGGAITEDDLNTIKANIIDGISGSATATAVANNQVSVLTGVTLTAGKLTRGSEYKLAAVAATGKAADIDFSDTVLVLNCGSSTVNV